MAAIAAFWAATVWGTGSETGAGGAPGVSPQVTGSLRSTPRGSKVTMSKSSSNWLVSTLSSLGKSSMPDTPGPPGLMTSEPIRSAGSSARCRSRAMPIVVPWGVA